MLFQKAYKLHLHMLRNYLGIQKTNKERERIRLIYYSTILNIQKGKSSKRAY